MTKYPVFDGHNDFAWEVRKQFGYATEPLGGSIPTTQTDFERILSLIHI